MLISAVIGVVVKNHGMDRLEIEREDGGRIRKI